MKDRDSIFSDTFSKCIGIAMKKMMITWVGHELSGNVTILRDQSSLSFIFLAILFFPRNFFAREKKFLSRNLFVQNFLVKNLVLLTNFGSG